MLDTEAQIASLSFFKIKAADLSDKKSKDLYEQLNPSYDIDDKHKRVTNSGKKGKVKNGKVGGKEN